MFDIFDVRFDRENQFAITRNLRVDNLFRIFHSWHKIEAKPVGYTLDVYEGFLGDEENELPKEFQNLPTLNPVTVTEEEFRTFLASHADDFDIKDNIRAQVPSVAFTNV